MLSCKSSKSIGESALRVPPSRPNRVPVLIIRGACGRLKAQGVRDCVQESLNSTSRPAARDYQAPLRFPGLRFTPAVTLNNTREVMTVPEILKALEPYTGRFPMKAMKAAI